MPKIRFDDDDCEDFKDKKKSLRLHRKGKPAKVSYWDEPIEQQKDDET